MVKVDGCKLCDAYETCLLDVAVNNIVTHKTFRDEWKTVYQSMMPSKVLDFLRTYEKKLREKYRIETDRFDSQALRLCIFINAMNTYPGNKITKTLRNSLIQAAKESIDFIPALKTQLKEKLDKKSVDEAVETLTELTDHQRSKQELYQEEIVQRLLKTSKTLREDPKTNLMTRYEINREFIDLLEKGQYASPQVAEYFLEEGNDWYELSRTSEAKWVDASMKLIGMAKLIFDRLDWPQEVEKCERIIARLKNLPNRSRE